MKRHVVVAVAFAAIVGLTAAGAADSVPKLYENQTVEEWLAELHSTDLGRQRKAFQVLRTLGPRAKDAIPPLVAAMSGSDELVGTTAAFGLASIGEDAIAPLSDAMNGKNPKTRARAIRAFQRMEPKPDRVLPLLAKRILDEDPQIRLAAIATVRVFGAAGTVALPELGKALTDPVAEVRLEAATAVSDLGEGAAPLAAKVVRLLSDPELRVLAARALGRMGPKASSAVGALIDALRERDPNTLLEVISALGKIGPAAHAAVPGLEEVLKGPAVGNMYIDGAARDALSRIAPKAGPKGEEEGR